MSFHISVTSRTAMVRLANSSCESAPRSAACCCFSKSPESKAANSPTLSSPAEVVINRLCAPDISSKLTPPASIPSLRARRASTGFPSREAVMSSVELTKSPPKAALSLPAVLTAPSNVENLSTIATSRDIPICRLSDAIANSLKAFVASSPYCAKNGAFALKSPSALLRSMLRSPASPAISFRSPSAAMALMPRLLVAMRMLSAATPASAPRVCKYPEVVAICV